MLPPTGGGTGYTSGHRKQAPTIRARMAAGITMPGVSASRRRRRAGGAALASGGPGPPGTAGSRASGSGPTIPDPRVQERIQQVREQVGEHHDEREDEDDRLYDDDVPVVDGLQQYLADPRQREDRLDDHQGSDEGPQVQTQAGEKPEHGVPHGLAEQHLPQRHT